MFGWLLLSFFCSFENFICLVNWASTAFWNYTDQWKSIWKWYSVFLLLLVLNGLMPTSRTKIAFARFFFVSFTNSSDVQTWATEQKQKPFHRKWMMKMRVLNTLSSNGLNEFREKFFKNRKKYGAYVVSQHRKLPKR